ncbi:MAG TPA: DUF4390 domain-containing protein [Gemmatimonadales bacterium]|nr:DUF4390 domain-containing protein [Gemmatimonadales bacterium]
MSPCRRLGLASALLALAAGALGAPPAQAQSGVRLEATLAADSSANGSRNPVVRSRNLLGDGRWLTALRSGLPVRLHYRVEVWRSRDGWFDLFDRQTEWDVVLRHEPLLDQYTLLTITGSRVQERRYATLDALNAALGFSYQVNVRPREQGEYYYAASLEISTLSDSDLDELERFLEGDLGGVTQGKEGIGDALGRGATRLLLRLAGLPSLRVETRTNGFRVR